MRMVFAGAALGALAALCLGPALAEDPIDAMVDRHIGALAPPAILSEPPVIETSGAAEPDIGLEGGGPGIACQPVYSSAIVRVGETTGDPEKDSLGRIVDGLECGPG
ncbi:hypothetical protein [Falsiroseomonas sp. HW251]|uniref:hypothetical protein n=1 Tax=Falsiroseomonas sp. HW251 TaxID=3390998 RepID=UPI003D322F7A